jgi:hypothetical protein
MPTDANGNRMPLLPFHGGNTGSNPVGDANKIKDLLETPFFAGDTPGDTNLFTPSSSSCPAA